MVNYFLNSEKRIDNVADALILVLILALSTTIIKSTRTHTSYKPIPRDETKDHQNNVENGDM